MAEECGISKDSVFLVLAVNGGLWYNFLGKLS
jgi:hypothetical protein